MPVTMSRRRLWIGVWAIAIVVSLSAFLGSSPLVDPDEGRNAEAGREMAQTNDYVLPHMNGLPYLDKPVAYFAAEAALMEVLGPTETAARLPALLFTLATIAVVAWFAKRTIGGDATLVATIVLASCPLVIAFARIVIFDSALGFFVTSSAIAFYLAIESRLEGRSSRPWAIAGWAAIGLGILTKGPVAILLPLLIAVPYGVYRRGARAIFSLAGVIVMAAIVAPWVWAVSQTLPDFLPYVLFTETISRLTSNELKRNAPFWYFAPYILVGAFPWIVLLPFQIRREVTRDSNGNLDHRFLFAALWLVLPFVFFSLSTSKRPQYLVPLMPAIALLSALAYEKCQAAIRGVRVTGIAVSAFGLIVAGAVAAGLHLKHVPPLFHSAATNTLITFAIVCLAAGTFTALRAATPALALGALAIVPLSIPLAFRPVIETAAEQRSARRIAAVVAPLAAQGVEVVSVASFRPSLAFYLRKPVLLASGDAEELTSNYILREFDRYISSSGTPLRTLRWFNDRVSRCDRPTIFVFDRKEAIPRNRISATSMRLLATSGKFVAYGPCRPPQEMR